MQLLQEQRYRRIKEEEEKAKGKAIADQAINEAIKFSPTPARSEFTPFIEKQTKVLMDEIVPNVRAGKMTQDDVYKQINQVKAYNNKIASFSKEADDLVKRWKESGTRNVSVINDALANNIYDIPLSGQMGTKVLMHPDKLNIDAFRESVENNSKSFSGEKLSESFFKQNIEKILTTKDEDSAGPFNSIIRRTKQSLPSAYTDGTYTPAGKLRLIVGEPGDPKSNKLLAQWDAMSPDHKKYLDLLVKENNPDLDLSTADQKDIGILRQQELQKLLDLNGHISKAPIKETVFRAPDSSAGDRSAADKAKILDSHAKVIHDILTGDDSAVKKAVTNLRNITDQEVKYDKANNTLTILVKKPDTPNMFGGPAIPGLAVPTVIDLSNPEEAVPLLNKAWQRVSPTKEELDSQVLIEKLREMGTFEKGRKKAPAPDMNTVLDRAVGAIDLSQPILAPQDDPLGLFQPKKK